MKRVVAVLLLLLAGVAAASAFLATDNAQRLAMQQAAGAISVGIMIPDDQRLADPDEMYGVLQYAALDAQVNLFRTSIGYTKDDRAHTTLYVLLTTGTELFDSFTLENGRWLAPGDSDHPERFLSTSATGNAGQVGLLSDFAGNDLITIRPLVTAFQSLPVAGGYLVEAPDEASFDSFVESLAARASQLAGTPGAFSADAFERTNATYAGNTATFTTFFDAIQILIVVFTALLLAFAVLHEAKKAGVMQLHGYGRIDVWFETAGRLILVCFLGSEVVALLASRAVADSTFAFSLSVGLAIARAFAVMVVVSVLASFYVARTRTSDSIKNRKDTRWLFAVNTIFKVTCSVALIAVGAGLVVRMEAVARERDLFSNWEQARGYGIFFPTSVGNDLVELQSGGNQTTAAEVYGAYPDLNARGALYVDATSYEPGAMTGQMPPGSYRSMVVNPNYLARFPVLDAAGREVRISEDTSDWLVLVPERLAAEKDEILAFFRQLRHGVIEANKTIFNRDAPDSVVGQDVQIVWLQDDQRIFSFDPLINPASGNVVVDPILQVMTLANSLGIDRANMFSGSAASAMKVKLADGDTSKTLAELTPTLARLKLDDNLRHLITMDEYASAQISALEATIRSLVIAGVAFLLGLLILAAQSIAILFERYARKVTVRRLFGAGFARTYREALLIFAVVWASQIVGALLANRLGINPFAPAGSDSAVPVPDGFVVVIAALIALLEAAASFVVLRLIERRGVVQVLKQEF